MEDAALWYAPILRHDHAEQRIAERVGPLEHLGEIRLALLCERFSAIRPRWTDRREPRPDRYETLYVWDETATRCWVLRRASGALYLITVLLDRAAWSELNESRRGVRHGSARV